MGLRALQLSLLSGVTDGFSGIWIDMIQMEAWYAVYFVTYIVRWGVGECSAAS